MKNLLNIASIVGLCLFLKAGTFRLDQIQMGALDPEDENEARINRLQPPDLVMDAFGIQPGMTVAEIGAGHGRFVVHLAMRVGPNGKVFAEDINETALNYLARRCYRWYLDNVETILGEISDPKLPEGQLDRIVIVLSYHHFEDPVALLEKARGALKPDGRLAICEWVPLSGGEGTPPELLKKQMEAAGYAFERMETFLQRNGVIFYLFRVDSGH